MHISTKLNIHRDLGCSGVLYSPSLYRADWSITQVLLGPEPKRSAQCDCGSAVTSCSGKTNLWEFDSRFLLSSWWHISAARWLKNECFQAESVHWVAGGESWHQLQHGHLEKKGLWTCTTGCLNWKVTIVVKRKSKSNASLHLRVNYTDRVPRYANRM